MNLNKLYNELKKEPRFRLKQAMRAIFINLINDWEEATSLPINFRNKLNENCPLDIKYELLESRDKNSLKALVTLEDGLKIESVLLKHNDNRNTVCVSSQVGCPLACEFCLTGKSGFKRNLSYGEIVEQVLLFSRLMKKENKKINNVVFMGMGEPFLNYENVIKAVKEINNKDGLNIASRHISISTIGITEGIKKFSNEKEQINLALSLHAPNDKKRIKIIPSAKKYKLNKIISSVSEYIIKTGRRVMIEYLMIKDFNDTTKDAAELSELLRSLNSNLFFINLIKYNRTGVYLPPTSENILEFKKVLKKNKINVTERFRFGDDISAACGQLASK